MRLVREQQRALITLINNAGEHATHRVTIRRLRGLERGSTDYSLARIAQHLAMSNRDIALTIRALVRDEDPPMDMVITNGKPSDDAQPDHALAELHNSIADLERALGELNAVRGATRTHPHPWFGALSASVWACVPSYHQAVHLKQAGLVAARL